MKKVSLTVGPQCAGKSTFCQRFVGSNPGVVLVSRDQILTELYGSPYFDPYLGDHLSGMAKMWEIVAGHLSLEGMTLILDCWNESARGRQEMVKRLCSLGADSVEAWYFTTPKEICVERFLARRPNPGKGNLEMQRVWEETYREQYLMAYRNFHSEPPALADGFDCVLEMSSI